MTKNRFKPGSLSDKIAQQQLGCDYEISQPQQKEQFSREDMMMAWTAGWGPTYSDGFEEWLTEYLNSKTKP